MTEMNQETCDHKGSLFLESSDQEGYRVRCGTCWILGPEREEPSDAVRAFREAQGSPPGAENTS